MADLALLLLTLAWGTTFLVVKNTLAGTSVGVLLILRFGLAAGAVGAVVLARRDRLPTATLRAGVLLGLAMFAGFALQTLGLRGTTPARSAFLTGLSVLIVPFLGRVLHGRRVGPSSWAAVALALAGLLLLTRPFADDIGAEVRAGDLLTVGCAVAYAFQIVYTSEWSPRHALAPLVLVQVATTFLLAPLLLPAEPVRLAATAATAGSVLYLALAMTAGAFFVMNWAQRHTTAVRAALIFSLEPVAAALFSHLVGGEPLGVLDWSGGALIVLGVILGEVGGALASRAAAPVPGT
ncbi:MAG TPA: DMT family transporter [Anaeromyxobacteraceae bacterium]|nr:DMT family transporter [Anaeromyxobacteraceae bacterium]